MTLQGSDKQHRGFFLPEFHARTGKGGILSLSLIGAHAAKVRRTVVDRYACRMSEVFQLLFITEEERTSEDIAYLRLFFVKPVPPFQPYF